MTSLAERVRAAILVTVPILDIVLVDEKDSSTWRVTPSELQAKAQPIIDSFDLTAMPSVREISPLEFARRFDDAELVAFEMLSSGADETAAAARVAKMKLALVKDAVHLDHPDTIKYLRFMKVVGILTDDRIAQILA